MATRKKGAAMSDETETGTADEAAEEAASTLEEARAVAQSAEACGHPAAFGRCFFAQIAEPCGVACQWLMDRGGAGR